MDYIYAALLINKAGGTINETTLTKVLAAAGTKADEARVRALVAALDGVDIQAAIKNAAVMPAAAAPVAAAPKKEEAKKEEKNEESAAEGLGSLFG